jgi:hypothetical protein
MDFGRIARGCIRRFNKFSPVNLTFPNQLTRLANRYESDKGTDYLDAHNYTRIYSELFQPIRDKPLTILEIGLLRVDRDFRRYFNGSEEKGANLKATSAPSLQMWRIYFPKAHLIGFDIDNFSEVKIDDCRIYQGDMSSRSDLESLVQNVGSKFDIVIDDASHVSHHQQIALGTLFPHVTSGGLYIIEDLQWQDMSLERPGARKTQKMLRDFAVTGSVNSDFLSLEETSSLESTIDSVDLFDSTQGTDALAVIRKR